MSPIALRRRTLTGLCAALQLALPLALSLAHATVTSGPGAPAHVEETSGSKCTTAHVDECIFCRHLSTSATKSPAPPSIIASPAIAERAEAGAVGARSLAHHPLQSRAPPDLSG